MKKTLFLSAILGAALCSTAWADTPLADYTTTVGGTTYSGAILEYQGNADTDISKATYHINKSGTEYDCAGNNENPNLGATDDRLWTYTTLTFGSGNHGHTLALTGVNGKTITLTSDWSNQKFSLGGVITGLADGATSGAYVVNGKCGDFVLVGNGGVNMNIGADTTLKTTSSNTVEVQGNGTWNIQEGKSLTLEGGRFWINGANTVTLSGGGTLKFNISNTNKIQLDANSGFNITGGTTVEMGNGLSCQFGTGAGFTSTDGTGKVNYVVTTTEVAGTTNGFGTHTYTAPGNLSIGDGVTLLLNGADATLTDGTLSAASTIYHIVESTAFNKASKDSYTGATGFQIENGATLSITEKTGGSDGIIYGDVVVKSGSTLQLGANDALGWSGGNVKSLLVENGAEVKLTHDSNETFGGALTLQGSATISGDNARWDFFTNSSITVAANATAAINTNGLQLRHAGSQATISMGNNATLNIGANITNGDRGDGTLVITGNHDSGSSINLNGGANGVGLQFGGVTANINKDMTVTQLMLSKNNALTTVNVAAGKTLTITGTSMATSNGSFELANWERNNILNIEGTVIANSGIVTEGSGAQPVINIKNGGTLTMNAGLSAVSRLGGNTRTTINAESGATLNVGGTADLANTDLITVNLKNGSTLGGAYGSGKTAVVNKNFVLADNATVTLQTEEGKTLTINGTLSNANGSISAKGKGDLVLNGTTQLKELTLGTDSKVTLGQGATVNHIDGGMGRNSDLLVCGDLTVTGIATLANLTVKEDATISLQEHIVSKLIVEAEKSVTLTSDAAVGSDQEHTISNVEVGSNAALTFGAANTTVGSITLFGGSTVTVGDAEGHDYSLTVNGLSVTGSGDTINADLVVNAGGELNFTFQNSILTMGCDVTIGSETGDAVNVYIHCSDDELASILSGGEKVLINGLTDADTITLGNANIYVNGTLNEDLHLALKADSSAIVVVVPEPATATLSLLALAALASRRRRH